MKRRIILGITITLLLLTSVLGSAAAKGNDPETFDHVDVRCAGSVAITTSTTDENTGKVTERTEVVPVEIANVSVKVNGKALAVGKKTASESATYPFEYQSARNLRIPANAKIEVTCSIALTYEGEDIAVTGTYRFTAADSNCEGTGKNKGIDLTVTAEKLRAVVIPALPTPTPVVTVTPTPVVTVTPTPVVTVTPTPGVTVTPTPVVTATPTPVVTPTPVITATPTPTQTIIITTMTPSPTPRITPTPRIYYIVPQTGETTDMWLVILLCTGLCAIAGIVLISVKRSHRNANRK